MIRNARIGAAEVEALAAHAGLPLAPGRAAVIAPVLDAWVADANALSRKMSEERCRLLVPVTVLVHPQTDEAER